MLQRRGGGSTPILSMKSQECHVLLQNLARYMLREQIRGVFQSFNLGQGEVATAQTVLYPQVGDRKMANLA